MMGYLSAVPEGSKEQRLKSWVMTLPEPGPLFYLWSWMWEIGMNSADGGIRYSEIKAWSEMTSTNVTPDEARALSDLAKTWFNELHRGRDKDALSPWFPEV
jgi:hypothetical protein